MTAKLRLLSSAMIFGAMLAGAGSVQAGDAPAKAADANGWAVYGHGYDTTRYSPLDQINSKNVSKLKLAYSFSLGSLRSDEATPIVVGDTLYVASSRGPKWVWALDAATGAQRWKYVPEIPHDVLRYACCDVNIRGVTYAGTIQTD